MPQPRGGDGGRGDRDALSDAHGAGVLGATALVDGDGEATLAVGAGGDGHEGDGVWDAGGRGVRQDLLDHRCHHHLVVAVAAGGSKAGGWVGVPRDVSPQSPQSRRTSRAWSAPPVHRCPRPQ